jgi:hypothetical protein
MHRLGWSLPNRPLSVPSPVSPIWFDSLGFSQCTTRKRSLDRRECTARERMPKRGAPTAQKPELQPLTASRPEPQIRRGPTFPILPLPAPSPVSPIWYDLLGFGWIHPDRVIPTLPLPAPSPVSSIWYDLLECTARKRSLDRRGAITAQRPEPQFGWIHPDRVIPTLPDPAPSPVSSIWYDLLECTARKRSLDRRGAITAQRPEPQFGWIHPDRVIPTLPDPAPSPFRQVWFDLVGFGQCIARKRSLDRRGALTAWRPEPQIRRGPTFPIHLPPAPRPFRQVWFDLLGFGWTQISAVGRDFPSFAFSATARDCEIKPKACLFPISISAFSFQHFSFSPPVL